MPAQASTREQVNYADLDSRGKQRFVSPTIRDGRTNSLEGSRGTALCRDVDLGAARGRAGVL